MALCGRVRPILTLGAPRLHRVADPVPKELFGTETLRGLVRDMIATMRAANGAGIAAPQVGEPWRVFVAHGTGRNPRYPYKPAIPLTVFVNPEIEPLPEEGAPEGAGPEQLNVIEGCLSVPGYRGRVQRHARVRCRAFTVDGAEFVVRAEGLAAGTLQHEYDHLDGRLFPDIALPGSLMSWDSFDQFHKEDFFRYAYSVNDKYPVPIVWEVGEPGAADAYDVPPAADQGGDGETKTQDATGTTGAATPPAGQPPRVVAYEPTLTWTGRAFERGVRVVVDQESGKILAVDKESTLRGTEADRVVPLEGRALLPGFVNAHSHAFQRGLRGRGETYPQSSNAEEEEVPSFWTWRKAMYGLVEELSTPEAFQAATRQCFQEMARAGITTCGEFHYFRHTPVSTGDGNETAENFDMDAAVIEAAREANVRLVLLSACYQRGGFDGSELGAGQTRFRTLDMDRYWQQMDRLTPLLDAGGRGDALGAVVHSLRAVGVPAMQALTAEAARRGMVLHMHLEEQPKEIEDCQAVHGKTPLALLLDSIPASSGGHAGHAEEDPLARLCAVHCTHSTHDELAQLLERGANVCICPLTEASLGDGVFQALEATHGVVSIGTDCNARIDMFEEMRWLEYSQRLARGRRGAFSSVVSAAATDSDEDGGNGHHDGDLARHLLECATTHGARALGVETGAIEPGKWADFAVVRLDAAALAGATDDTMLGAAIFGGAAEGLVQDTCVAGRWTNQTAEGESGPAS